MYHCHIRFYLVGQNNPIFEQLKDMNPFARFSHEFFESAAPDSALTSKASIIFANLQSTNTAQTLDALLSQKNAETNLIVLTGKDEIINISKYLSAITDIWTFPMSDAECAFRLQKWQQDYKARIDAWETSQYLETTINGTPDLIWYKDKNGIHEKVNDSFCKTVNKSKALVEGRGHAYIWDVETDDPACIESDRIVMEAKETRVSEEVIQSGGETKILTTYKSPLYDLDGSVMGTVGTAIDITQERSYAQGLIQQNQTLEMLFTTMDCGVMCHTLDGSRIVSINKAALDILGYPSEEALIDAGFDLIAASVLPEDRIRLKQRVITLVLTTE